MYPPPCETCGDHDQRKKNDGSSCCFRGRSIRIGGWWHGRCRFLKLTSIKFMENTR